ncbi:DUF3224 domain-containing protein [Endozoicomonas sp. G2_1]|uniref:DUF3224 domain-containing protein n=1 Tax=Endozoicomonas sp. G2_1 TaxID=2821091 RepID=UPI001ADCA34D|nr:DUF3224 domain-containing protein [Endozoicomonas sp. G2_1]MBO9492418.1 DUF3224 domain-containing protein [Endozoicomonas sp. G2_1]
MKISGKFDVALEPMETYAAGLEGSNLGRMSINKTFHGDLSAESKGEMLNVMTPVKGSAGYVAIEQVSGSLSGKRRTFVLQHYGIMSGGKDKLVLEVVPDSATGELVGLTGQMTIRIESGQHYYDFEYKKV